MQQHENHALYSRVAAVEKLTCLEQRSVSRGEPRVHPLVRAGVQRLRVALRVDPQQETRPLVADQLGAVLVLHAPPDEPDQHRDAAEHNHDEDNGGERAHCRGAFAVRDRRAGRLRQSLER